MGQVGLSPKVYILDLKKQEHMSSAESLRKIQQECLTSVTVHTSYKHDFCLDKAQCNET